MSRAPLLLLAVLAACEAPTRPLDRCDTTIVWLVYSPVIDPPVADTVIRCGR